MRFCIFPTAAFVHIDVFIRVYGQGTVRIDCDQEQARVGIYKVGLISHVKIVNDGCFVEMGELGHIIRLVEFRRIDLIGALGINFSLLDRYVSKTQDQQRLIGATYASIVALNEYPIAAEIFDDPSFHESSLWILKPDISLS